MIVGICNDIWCRIEKWSRPERAIQAHEPAMSVLKHIHVKSGVPQVAWDLIDSEE
jgi:hypothetical protein